jgi:hypothetical protein
MGGGGEEAVVGAAGVVVVVSDELAAMVTRLPALSSHVCQWYVEQCRTSHSQDCMV